MKLTSGAPDPKWIKEMLEKIKKEKKQGESKAEDNGGNTGDSEQKQK
jgi:hypothetical protein